MGLEGDCSGEARLEAPEGPPHVAAGKPDQEIWLRIFLEIQLAAASARSSSHVLIPANVQDPVVRRSGSTVMAPHGSMLRGARFGVHVEM